MTGTVPPGPGRGTAILRAGMVDNVRLPGSADPDRFVADLVSRPAGPGQETGCGERLRLVWIGQRSVPGIEPGRWLRVEGVLAEHEGTPTVFNPRYELLAGAPDD